MCRRFIDNRGTNKAAETKQRKPPITQQPRRAFFVHIVGAVAQHRIAMYQPAIRCRFRDRRHFRNDVINEKTEDPGLRRYI